METSILMDVHMKNLSMQLGYLVFGVAKPARWAEFCEAMLGLPAPVQNTDGSRGWRLDGASQRLIVQEDARDDVLALGLDCGDEVALQRTVTRLAGAGWRVAPADDALLAARRVRRLYRAQDPEGNGVELFSALAQTTEPFVSGAFPGGFRTGDLGMGHAVLVSHDLEAMEAFYVDGLGFGVTERLNTRVGPIAIRGTFLHCNRRHQHGRGACRQRRPGAVQHGLQAAAIFRLEPSQQLRIAVVEGLHARQQVKRQHRGHCHRHYQRGQR